MPNADWMENPALIKMDPRKKKIIKNLMRQSKGIPLNQSLPLIMDTQRQMQMQGLSFTPDERDILFAILSTDMTPQEKQQFEAIKKIMKLH